MLLAVSVFRQVMQYLSLICLLSMANGWMGGRVGEKGSPGMTGALLS